MLEDIFKQVAIFADLDPDQYALLKPIFSVCLCEEGEIIFEQGDSADHLYIVISGEVVIVFQPDDGETINVAHIHAGGVFGWSAAFGSDTYTSGAVCRDQAKMLKVLGCDLKQLHQNHPETGILVLKRLATVVAERLRSSAMHAQVVAMLEHGLINGIKPIGG